MSAVKWISLSLGCLFLMLRGPLKAQNGPISEGQFAPTITLQPTNQPAAAGTTVVWRVAASGTAPMSIQWWADSTMLAGATNTELSLPPVDGWQTGVKYYATVTNAYGSATSDVAQVSSPDLWIVRDLRNVRPTLGYPFTLRVIAAGIEPIKYQWFLDGEPLTNGTQSSLKFDMVTNENAGRYTVTVSNSLGSVTSAPAVLVPQEGYTFDRLTGTGTVGISDGSTNFAMFDHPYPLAIGTNGTIYIADTWAGSLRTIDTNWQTQTTIRPRFFGNPFGIAIDRSNNIYISDSDHNRIFCKPSVGTNFVFAGDGVIGDSDGFATAARFHNPQGLAFQVDGSLLVSDTENHTIRRIGIDGRVVTIAGRSRKPGYRDGNATDAQFNHPVGIAIDSRGNAYICDGLNNCIRRISIDGNVTTMAGSPVKSGLIDGDSRDSALYYPTYLTVTREGEILISDDFNQRIRKIDSKGFVTSVAGKLGTNSVGRSGYANGIGPAAWFNSCNGIGIDAENRIIVADSNDQRIRIGTTARQHAFAITSITQSTEIMSGDTLRLKASFASEFECIPQWSLNGHPISGETNSFYSKANVSTDDTGTYKLELRSLAGGILDSKSLYVAVVDALPRILKQPQFDPGNLPGGQLEVTASGSLPLHYQWSLDAVPVPGGTNPTLGLSFLGDGKCHGVTVKIWNQQGSTVSDPLTIGPNGRTWFAVPEAIDATDGYPFEIRLPRGELEATELRWRHDGNLVQNSADDVLAFDSMAQKNGGSYQISFLEPSSTSTCTLETSLEVKQAYHFETLAGSGNMAQFHSLGGLAIDSNSVVYVADSQNKYIIRIAPGGKVSSVPDPSANEGQPMLFQPGDVAVDSSGTLYVSELASRLVKKVTPSGLVTVLAGNSLIAGYRDGRGTNAAFGTPSGIAVDKAGFIYVADSSSHTIRRISPDGYVSTVAGGAGKAGTRDGLGNEARFNSPADICIGDDYCIYVADTGNHTIRMISPAGRVSTIAGSPGSPGSVDGTLESARFSGPRGISVDAKGGLFVADTANNIVRVIRNGTVRTLAGVPGGGGYREGGGTAAVLGVLVGIAVDENGALYVADQAGGRVWKGTDMNSYEGVDLGPTPLALLGERLRWSASLRMENDNQYQWLRDGVAIPGATNAMLDIPVESTSVSGNYSLVVRNGAGIRRSEDRQISGVVDPGPTEPRILVQPENALATIDVGQDFRVVAGGARPLSFQWFHDGRRLEGATNEMLVLKAVTQADFGNYHAVVSNRYGSCTSRRAKLGGAESVFAGEPRGGKPIAGYPFTFKAVSFVPMEYRWWKNGVELLDEEEPWRTAEASLTVEVGPDDHAAEYSVGGLSEFGFNSSPGVVLEAPASPYEVKTLATNVVPGELNSMALQIDGSMVAASRYAVFRVRSDGVAELIAGSSSESGHVDGLGALARFGFVSGLALAGDGSIYVVDGGNYCVRKINSDNMVVTVAGSGRQGYRDGPAKEAMFQSPHGIAIGRSGMIYISEPGGHTIRRITPDGIVSTIAGGVGLGGTIDGVGLRARFLTPYGIAVDSDENLYVTDYFALRRIGPTGEVFTIAGRMPRIHVSDGVAQLESFFNSLACAVDRDWNVFVSDSGHHAIRCVSRDGLMSTLAGSYEEAGFFDGAGNHAGLPEPSDIAVNADGTLVFADMSYRAIRFAYPPPRLAIEQLGADLVLEWTSDIGGERLEAMNDLSLQGRWTEIKGEIQQSGNRFTMQIPATDGARFFRLRRWE